jgi:hypothetical protein
MGQHNVGSPTKVPELPLSPPTRTREFHRPACRTPASFPVRPVCCTTGQANVRSYCLAQGSITRAHGSTSGAGSGSARSDPCRSGGAPRPPAPEHGCALWDCSRSWEGLRWEPVLPRDLAPPLLPCTLTARRSPCTIRPRCWTCTIGQTLPPGIPSSPRPPPDRPITSNLPEASRPSCSFRWPSATQSQSSQYQTYMWPALTYRAPSQIIHSPSAAFQ